MNGHFIISRKVHKNLMQAYANFKFADVEGQDQEKMDFISAMEDLKEEAAWVETDKPGFWLREWTDETSMFDPNGRHVYDGYYEASYKAWIPNEISEDDDNAIDNYLADHPHAYVT